MSFESLIEKINEERIEEKLPLIEVGREYIKWILYYSEVTEPYFGYVLACTINSLEEKYGIKVRCPVETVKILDVLRILGGNNERYPTGWENIVEEYRNNEKALELGKIINHLEKNLKFEKENEELIIV